MAGTEQLAGGVQEPVLIYDRIASNKRRTWLLMFAFVVLLGGLVTLFAWLWGVDLFFTPLVFLALAIYAGFSYFASASVTLGVSGARQVSKEQEPELYRIVENLSIGSGLPMPKVYVIEDSAPNAFATGRDPKHASVAAT